MRNQIYIILGIILLKVQLAQGQSPKVFLKGQINLGTEIPAETLISGYSNKGYIDIWNVSFAPSNNKLIVPVYSVNNPTAKATPGVLTFTKNKSKSSKLFHEQIIKGNKFPTIEIAFAKFIGNGSNAYQTYMNYKMEDVFVVSIKDNNDFTETIEIVINKVQIAFKPTNPQTGQLDTAIFYSWDFGANAVWNTALSTF